MFTALVYRIGTIVALCPHAGRRLPIWQCFPLRWRRSLKSWLLKTICCQVQAAADAARIKCASRISGQGLVAPCENERPVNASAERKVQPGNHLASIRADDSRLAKVLCESADAPRASTLQRAS